MGLVLSILIKRMRMLVKEQIEKCFGVCGKRLLKSNLYPKERPTAVYSKIVELNSPYDSVFMEILNAYYASSIEGDSE
jgi:hypothetical protein